MSENKVKTIGVLSSGGDAPGMNAVIRSVVRTALSKGMKVIGFKQGYVGLMNLEYEELDLRSVSDIIQLGGTMLFTARCKEFNTPEGVKKAADNCKKLGIDGIVAIGGDGTFRGARDLSLAGIPCIGIPCTIDNDISSSDYTVGYDTALNTVCEMADKLRSTTQSHYRCSVIEVMGRHAGHIALEAGIAVGATCIIVEEVPHSIEDVIAKIESSRKLGKHHFIIMVSEGVGHSNEIAKKIEDATGIETRATILGHVQRGGAPTVRDRVVATRLGYHGVNLLEKGIGNRVVVTNKDEVIDYDILEALSMKKTIDMDLYEMAHEISI
ncbi:MAG: 6-phosphofructokinase [Clostridia bacterium]|nr:6-phosphofructokinase [Clostridia bacterium]